MMMFQLPRSCALRRADAWPLVEASPSLATRIQWPIGVSVTRSCSSSGPGRPERRRRGRREQAGAVCRSLRSQPGDVGWGSQEPAPAEGWDLTDAETEDELDLFPEPEGDPEFALQNALALTLLGLLALSFGNVLFKMVLVLYALVAAAFRYTAVGILLLVALYWFLD